MKISGFSFVRNADKLGYPLVESIQSILPICDEFLIAVGDSDPDDQTKKFILSIGSPKIKIIDTHWADLTKLRGQIYSQQTNIALKECSGDWCFYLQCDEVVHEKFLPHIKEQCEKYLPCRKVEGFLFNYKHFWGDYDHYIVNHKWYPREIRIVRNTKGVRSIGDAQSFSMEKRKLQVVQLDAEIFHYGYVRHPKRMQARNLVIESNYHGEKEAKVRFQSMDSHFDYGALEKIPVYSGSYPAVMADRIQRMDWKDLLQYSGKSKTAFHHEKRKYKILTFLEQKIFRGSGKQPWGYKNYTVLKKKAIKQL